MTENTTALVRRDEAGAAAANYRMDIPPDAQAVAESVNIYRLLWQSLRGRLLLCAAICFVCSSLLVVAAYKLVKPVYRSVAIIRIAYDAPSFAAAGADNKPIEAFDAFMHSQEALIGSQRVLDMASKDPAWAAMNVKPTSASMAWMAQDLRVERASGAEHIMVGLESPNPRYAATAVQAVVNAYASLYSSTDNKVIEDKMRSLTARQQEVDGRIAAVDDRLRAVVVEFGSSNIEKFHDSAVQQLSKVESMLVDVQIALVLASAPVKKAGILSPQQIARFDQTMARYLAEREQMESQVEQLRLRGYGEGHKQLIQAQKALATIVHRIQDYAVDFQGMNVSAPTNPAVGAAVANAAATNILYGRSQEELKSDESKLLELRGQVKKQLYDLGNKKAQIDALKIERDKHEAELTELSQKIASAQLEGSLSGRMSVVSPAEVPVVPVKNRRPQMMIIGMMMGSGLPVAGFVVVGLLRRRYRYSDDATQDLGGRVPLLGILPLLPHRLNDPESAADAAQCVHQIRVMLQVNQKKSGPVSYMVTSSCPGEGKTSLATSLAMSFAVSGARTLLMDTDLIGQRVTRGFGAEKERGFRDVLAGRSDDVTIVQTHTPNLSLLPCGVSDGRDACAVSAQAVKRLLIQCSADYDVIIVDSGPILGSLEASVVAGQVDGVVLTISREQQKPLVDRAISHLRSVGAQVAGMVFNKAERRDFYRSVSASSLRSISAKGRETSSLVKAGVTATSGFGSLVDSVQSYMPSGN